MLMLVVAVLALATRAEANPPSTTRYFVAGGGLSVDFSSEDGTTSGTVLGMSARAGQDPRVPYKTFLWVFANRAGEQFPFLGVTEATVQVTGMNSARAQGLVTLVPLFGGGSSIIVDVDVALAGTGAVHAETTTYTSGSKGSSYVDFLSQRSRAATVSGSVVVDGAGATTGNAAILGVTSGEFDHVAQP